MKDFIELLKDGHEVRLSYKNENEIALRVVKPATGSHDTSVIPVEKFEFEQNLIDATKKAVANIWMQEENQKPKK